MIAGEADINIGVTTSGNGTLLSSRHFDGKSNADLKDENDKPRGFICFETV